jgi:hypothetical protein
VAWRLPPDCAHPSPVLPAPVTGLPAKLSSRPTDLLGGSPPLPPPGRNERSRCFLTLYTCCYRRRAPGAKVYVRS